MKVQVSSTRHASEFVTFEHSFSKYGLQISAMGMQSGERGGWKHAGAKGAVCQGVSHQRGPAHPHQPAGHSQGPSLQGKVSADTEVSTQPM